MVLVATDLENMTEGEAECFTLYLRDLELIDLLSPVEEIRLGSIIQRGVRFEMVLNDLRRYEKIYHFTPPALAARNRMVEANLKLAIHFAKRIRAVRKTVLPIEDLTAEGNIGLIHAATTFDPAKGFRFSTYAAWWVRRDIHRAISGYQQWCRAPEGVALRIADVQRATSDYEAVYGKTPPPHELAALLGYTLAEVIEAQSLDRIPKSLYSYPQSKATFREHKDTLADSLPADAAPESRRLTLTDQERLRALIARNPDRMQRDAIARFLGVAGDGVTWSYADLAAARNAPDIATRRFIKRAADHLTRTARADLLACLVCRLQSRATCPVD